MKITTLSEKPEIRFKMDHKEALSDGLSDAKTSMTRRWYGV